MRARPPLRAEIGGVLALALVVACAAPVPQTPTPPAGESQTPVASSPVTSPDGGPIGDEPIGGAANQPPPGDWAPVPSDKILADVDAGKIDADTGLMYRIFASFADPRLPAQYSGGPPDIDEAALNEAVFRQENGDLPPAIAEAVRTYLLRPTNPDSAFYGGPATGNRGSDIVPAAFVAQDQPACGANGWATLLSATQPVKVWVRCDDARLAGLLRDALEAAETLYSEESDADMMGPAILDTGAPLTDAGKDAGGDNAIDIYFTGRLVCINRARADCATSTLASVDGAGMAVATTPFSASSGPYTSSAYIVIDRAYGDSKTDIWSLIAHEMFHVLQDAHNLGGRLEGGKYHWFTEASAKWSSQYFVPDARPKWTYPRFAQFQTASVGLTSTEAGNPYASFVWPYFMEHKAKWTSIGDTWRAIDGKVGWEAINAAMAGVFSFEKNYKDFAVQALNTRLNPGDPAAPEMQVPDARFPPYAPELASSPADDKKQLVLGRLGAHAEGDPVVIPVKVLPLAMRYHIFGVAEDVKKLVVDFSGVQPSHALDVEALLRIHDKGWERRALSDGKTTFCRDRPADNVDAVILVIANHSWADAETLSGSYKLLPTAKPCDESQLHLGGTISWSRESTLILRSPGSPDWERHVTVSGQAQIVLKLTDTGYHYELIAERDGGSTYSYDYSFHETNGTENCDSHEVGTLETWGGVPDADFGDWSIGQLNPTGGLFEDITLDLNIWDYCGPNMGKNIPDPRPRQFEGFIKCPEDEFQLTAEFDGGTSYVVDCSYQYDRSLEADTDTGSGEVHGTLTIIDGPHPTPR
jgi:hypothetical protein